VSELRRVLVDVRIVAMVQPGSVEAALEAMGRGAHFYLMKPVEPRLSNAFTGGRRSATRGQPLTMARVEWDTCSGSWPSATETSPRRRAGWGSPGAPSNSS